MKQGREHWGSQGKGQVAEAGQSRMPAPLCTRKGPAPPALRSIEQDESLGADGRGKPGQATGCSSSPSGQPLLQTGVTVQSRASDSSGMELGPQKSASSGGKLGGRLNSRPG